MASKLEVWLANLSDPAGVNERWSPQPFGPSQYGQLSRLIAAAELHNIRPAVVANLNHLVRTRPDAVFAAKDESGESDKLLAEANDERLSDLARSLLLDKAASEILRDTAARGIPVALVKGAEFAKSAYGGLHLRSFSDVDLLVDPQAEDELGNVLRDHGFKDIPPRKMRFERTERQWIRPDSHGNMLLVEVHTDMIHDPALRQHLSLTYKDYTDPAFGGVTPAARLVLAALHGAASHLFGRLQYVADGLMIVRMKVDAEELRARAARAGAILPLATMLRLCTQIYGNDEAAQLARELGPVSWDGLQRRLITTPMVLAAKGANRWRLLPQRYIYRRLLRSGEPLGAQGAVG